MAGLKLQKVRPVLEDEPPAPAKKGGTLEPTPEKPEPTRAKRPKRASASPASSPQGRRRQTSLTLLPELIERQEAIAERLSEEQSRRVSFAQMFAATAFYALPEDPDDAHELVLRWARLRAATTDPYKGARGREINVRLDEDLVDRLDRLSRELRRRGVSRPRSMLANAALHFNAPADVDDGRDQLARYELARLEQPTAA